MKCKIISISHKLSNWEQQALQFYSKQLPSNFKISYAEAKPSSSKNLDKESILEAERIELVKYIETDSHVILWDRKGQKINSNSFAALLQDKIDLGISINFIIGGSYGASEKLFKTFLTLLKKIVIGGSVIYTHWSSLPESRARGVRG